VLAGGLSLWWNNRTGEHISGPARDYEKELEKLRRIDPSLIIYAESVKPIAAGFAVPRAIAVGPEDHIYVTGDKTVRRFDRAGNPSGRDIVLKETGYCLAVSEQDTIFVGMKDHVEVYDQQGKIITRWDVLKSEGRLTSIAVREDDVFVAVYLKRFGIVYHYDRFGQFLNMIQQERPGRQDTPFDVPSPYFDVAVGPV